MAIPQVINANQINAIPLLANALLFVNTAGGINSNANIVYDQVNNYLNINANITASNTFMVNTNTRVQTGLAANMTANVQTTGTITGANILPVFFNEPGMYAFDGMIFVSATTAAGQNASNVGVNIAFLNSATATVNTVRLGITCRTNGNTTMVNTIGTNAQTAVLPVAAAVQTGSLSTPVAATPFSNDYLDIQGIVTINAAGMAQTQIAAANTLNNNLQIWSNSYIVFTKIG